MRSWIDGAWAGSGPRDESIEPATGMVLGAFRTATEADGVTAIAAARRAFDMTSWSRDAPRRAEVLLELADRLTTHQNDLAMMLARENGKLLSEARGEVAMSIETVRINAARARLQMYGQSIEQSPGVYWHNAPEPLGVAGVISPWNGPLLLSLRSIAPALAAGCTVVAKMPAQTALTAGLLVTAISETTSIPPGVVNVLIESGNAVAPLLVTSPDIDVLSYTGSTHVGRIIAASAAPTVKRLSLELGGKTPLLVMDDADIDRIVPTIVRSATFMNGQYCGTGARVLVQRAVADHLRDALTTAISNVVIGRPEDSTTELGPLIDKAAAKRVDGIVARAEGYATVLVRGGIPSEPAYASGAFFRPALVEVSDVRAPIVQSEVFGPVQTFEVFDTEADAIRMANATEYGLAAAVFSRDDLRARRIGRELRVANVWINNFGIPTQMMTAEPVKQSGYGSTAGPMAVETYQYLKRYGTAELRLS